MTGDQNLAVTVAAILSTFATSAVMVAATWRQAGTSSARRTAVLLGIVLGIPVVAGLRSGYREHLGGYLFVGAAIPLLVVVASRGKPLDVMDVGTRRMLQPDFVDDRERQRLRRRDEWSVIGLVLLAIPVAALVLTVLGH